ncbi:MAG: ABC transporter ATP-binding protein [Lachnospiraceae bacterium]|nr:ABC transporter ATP-binding protein [Lachnospiraceae bacterium]
MAGKENMGPVPKGPGARGRGPRPKIENPGKLFKRIMKYVFKYYWFHCIIVFIGIIVSALAGAQGTMFTKSLIDDYIIPLTKAADPDFSGLLTKILQVAAFYGAGILGTFLYSRLMIYVTQGTLQKLRVEMFTKMESLPIKYFDTHAHGDIMSIYTNDIDTLRQMISQSIPQSISCLVTIASVFIYMVILSIPLTIITLLMIGVSFYATKKLAGLSGSYFLAQQKDIGKVNGYIEEMMEGQKVIKVFCHEEESGSLVSFLTFNKSFSMPINQISQQLNAVVMALAGADRVFKLIDEKPETDDGYVELVNAKEDGKGGITESEARTGMWAWKHYHKDSDTTTYVKMQGDLVFDHVDFGYNDDKIILHDIEIYAKPGQKIAFVGATGAGKTTITNLINRFYDIQDGKIRYDGININKIKKKDLRQSLGIVLQDTHLFTGTVMENIRYGKLDATDEEVMEAAKLANAHSFIKRLPDGYNTMLTGDGANLSQGQRQLLAIARAAVADPPALILDEATSSIDTRTEKLVQKGMDRLMRGRTTFVIAHRLSTVRNSDCIMVLEQGHIIERGTHDELIEKQGKYYQLYTGKLGSGIAG